MSATGKSLAVLAVLAVASIPGLAITYVTRPVPSPPLGIERVVLLQRDAEFGHACPVEKGLITVRHMMNDERSLGWSVGGLKGFIPPSEWHQHMFMDAAIASLPAGIKPIPIGPDPKVGDRVTIVGMNSSRSFARKWLTTTVLSVNGFMVVTAESPGPGSSGSCLLDTKGHAVGLNIGMHQEGTFKLNRGVAVVMSGVS